MPKTKKTTSTMRIQYITNEQLKKASRNDKAFEQLLQHNKGFIEKIVLTYVRRNHCDFDSLYWVGAGSLYHALKKFNPDREGASKFSTFAYKVIQNDVLKEVKRMQEINSKETSMELFTNENNRMHPEYVESKWVHTNSVVMEDQLVDQIAREQYMNVFADVEKQILNLKMQGYTMREIAKKLGKNFHTLKTIFNNTTHNATYKRMFNEIF